MLTWAWPKSSWTTFGCSPSDSSNVAAVCRSAWKVTGGNPALTDTAPRDGLHRAAVLSDGATRLVDRIGLLDWSRFLDTLAEQGPDMVIQRVRAAEDSDPDGQRWPRGKRHDDASAAFCQLT